MIIYEGIKLLNSNKDIYRNIFKKSDDDIFKKLVCFYRELLNNSSHEKSIKNIKVLLNVLTAMSFNIKLNKKNLHILMLLISNLEAIQHSIETSDSSIFIKCENKQESTYCTEISDVHRSEDITNVDNKIDAVSKTDTDTKEDDKTKTEENKTEESDTIVELSYDNIVNDLTNIIKNFSIMKSLVKIYCETIDGFMGKFLMFECDKIVNPVDVHYCNNILTNLYDKFKTIYNEIWVKLKELHGVMIKLGLKTIKFGNIFDLCIHIMVGTVTLHDITIQNIKFILIKTKDIELKLYYLYTDITFEIMLRLLDHNLAVLPEINKILDSNILMTMQDLDILQLMISIECKDIKDICNEVNEIE